MLKEGAVLRREESAHEQRRIFAVVELDAAFAGIAVDRLALAIPHEGGERRFIVAKLVDRGQIAREGHPDQREAEQARRSEEHTSELQSQMRLSYAVFCLTQKKKMTESKTT